MIRWPVPAPTPRSRVADRIALVLGGLGTLFLLAQLLHFPHGRDQAIFALVAQACLQGGAPYLDAWDFKPPGIYGVYALAQGVFGATELAIRLLEVLAILATFAGFVVLSRRAVQSSAAGLIGGLVATLAWVELGFWHSAQPESFGAPVLTWALVAASAPGSRPTDFLAGALYTCAALLKPPLGGGYLVSLAAGLKGSAQRGATLLAYVLGAAAVLALVAGWFLAKDAWGAMLDTVFVWTRGYTALSTDWSALPAGLAKAVYLWLIGFSPFHAPGLALCLLLPAATPRERRLSLHVLGVIGVVLFGVALQGKFFEYHFGAALPLAGLLAGWGYWKLWIRLRTSLAGQLLAAAAAAAILLGAVPTSYPGPRALWRRCSLRLSLLRQPDQALHDSLYSRPDSPAAPRRKAAEWLSSNTEPGATIFVWGFEPGLYLQSKRQPASRYIYNVPQRVSWDRARHRERLLAELRATPPAAVIVQSDDALPWVTGSSAGSREELLDFPGLRSWLEGRYVLAEQFESLSVYLRSMTE